MANEKTNAQYDYSSTQVNVPGPLSAEIIQWGEDHIKDSELFSTPDDPSFGREDEMHITLLYGLQTNNPDPVKKTLADEPAFEVHLGVVSLFRMNDKFDVIKIEVQSPKLHKLHHTLNRNLTCNQMYNSFQPHVTIAYVKKNACDRLLGDKSFKGKTWTAQAVVFSSKSGAKTTIPLKPASPA